MKKILPILIFLFFIFSCQEKSYSPELVQVDSLLFFEKPDSAMLLLKKIKASTLSEHDKTYYDLLYTFTQFKLYMPIEDYSLINRCIAYYSNTEEKEKLGRSWLYKGNILTEQGKLKEAVTYLKKAEQIAKETGNADLSIRVFAALAYVNAETHNSHKALEYIQGVLRYAKEYNRRRWIGHAYLSMSNIYSDLNKQDSADAYKRRAIEYIQDIPLKERAVHLSVLSLYFKKKKDYRQAESFLLQSLNISPLPYTYGTLASLYTTTNQTEKAKRLWNQAFKEKAPQQRCAFMQPYADWLYKIGEKDSAWKVAMKIPFVKDSIMRIQQTEIIKEEQEEHDREMSALHYRHRIELSIALIISLILLLLLIWSFSYMKIQKKKKQIAEEQATISEYQLQIGQLSAEGKEHEKKTKELERKVSELRKKQGMSLSKGMARFKEIMDGGSTIRWRRSDYNDFLEYYRTIDLIFMTELEEDYKQLSGSQKFYLVLLKTGKTEKEAQTVMALSDEAMRTMKSRIAKEKISYED